MTFFRTKHHGDHAEPTSGGSGEVADVTEAAAKDLVHAAVVGLAAEREQARQGGDGQSRVGRQSLQAHWTGSCPTRRVRSQEQCGQANLLHHGRAETTRRSPRRSGQATRS